MIYEELQIEQLKIHKSEIMELFIDTYMINFQLNKKDAIILCLEKLDLLERYIDDGSAIVIGAIDNGTLYGVIWLYRHDIFGEKRLHVNQIAVDKEARCKGIGKHLIQKAEEYALKLGITNIDLFVMESNKIALKLYDNLGFETEKRYMKKKL